MAKIICPVCGSAYNTETEIWEKGKTLDEIQNDEFNQLKQRVTTLELKSEERKSEHKSSEWEW